MAKLHHTQTIGGHTSSSQGVYTRDLLFIQGIDRIKMANNLNIK